jgi:hypothetical protein
MSTFINKIFNTPLLQNKFVLYASLFVVLFALVRNISNGNMNAVILMALVGLLTSYFSKNMIIILLTTFFTVFILEMIGSQGVMEGMETKKDNKKENKNKENKNKEEENNDEENKEEENKDEKDDKKKDDTKEPNTTLHSKNEPKKKMKQGMSTLSPASYDGQDHESGEGESAHRAKEANRIDYASTLEEAYDNIENIIGEDGVRGLTDQTKSLMNQQKELMNNMKEMGPLLKSAEGFMEQLTGGGGIKGITEMLKGFATPGGGGGGGKK